MGAALILLEFLRFAHRVAWRSCASIVAPDGSIFVGIGGLGEQSDAQGDDSVGGKISRIDSDSHSDDEQEDENNELVEGATTGWPLRRLVTRHRGARRPGGH